jgi:hypothetical protein
MSDGWAEQRARAIDAHAADLARRTAVESEKAAAMLREFVTVARERGVPSEPLVARSYDGRRRFRTGLRGWYLRPDEGIAVGEDGRYYVLAVPGSLRGMLTGVTLTPSPPRLVLGEGGRDGERVTLRAALDHVLARAT